MRTFICVLGGICVFVFLASSPCHSMERKKEGISYPEGNIKEIRIYGTYKPEDPQRLENFKKKLISFGHLRSGDTLEKKYSQFSNIGDEKIGRFLRFNYCYEKTPDSKKKPVFNKNLRVRLYDVNEDVIAEDYLRVSKFDKENNLYFTFSYIPYEEKGHYFRIVRLEGEKEIILWKPGVRGATILSKAQLIHWSRPLPYGFDNKFEYLSKTKCHHDRFKIR